MERSAYFSASCATTTRVAACAASRTARTARWRRGCSRRLQPKPQSAPAVTGSPSSTAPGSWRWVRRVSRSRSPRRTARKRSTRVATSMATRRGSTAPSPRWRMTESRALPVVDASDSADMRDGFGRRIEYLRVSVTDKCNLRCVYCMPVEGLPWLSRAEILSYEEIEQIVREMAAMGLRRVRLTGGEPLVRRDVHTLAARIAAIDGIDDLSLSTNAVLLAEQAGALRDAGVRRLNVSLDSLRPERVDAIARRPGAHERIFAGLAEAERAGFDPIKVNVVVMRGRNDDEIEDFARITQERPWHVRFIEVMPVGDNLDISSHEYMPAVEMLARVQRIGAL